MPSKTNAIDEDVVRTRAYLMWEADGRPHGNAEHYWSLAHAEATAAAKPKRAAARVASAAAVGKPLATAKAPAKGKKTKA